MKLELGSGDRPTPGFVHLDQREDLPDIDLVGDVVALNDLTLILPDGTRTFAAVELGSCEEIRATHLLEHFSHRETVALLRHWRTYLKPGGLLYLEVPDLAGHVAAWRRRESTDEMFVEYLYGRQDYDGNYHKTLFTTATLNKALTDAGLIVTYVRSVGLVICAEAMR